MTAKRARSLYLLQPDDIAGLNEFGDTVQVFLAIQPPGTMDVVGRYTQRRSLKPIVSLFALQSDAVSRSHRPRPACRKEADQCERGQDYPGCGHLSRFWALWKKRSMDKTELATCLYCVRQCRVLKLLILPLLQATFRTNRIYENRLRQ